MSRCSSGMALLLAVSIAISPAASAQDLPDIESFVDGFDVKHGFYTVYWNPEKAKVWLEIGALGEDLLYVGSLAAGLGSNDIGLDRGQLGQRRIVRLERVGPRVFMFVPNLRYRADGAEQAETQTVTDAFAAGVEWAFDIAAETDGRLLVDATDFLLRDIHGVARTLDARKQGQYEIDRRRSTPLPDGIRSFPDNTELEVSLTFAHKEPGRASSQPGAYVRDVAASPESITLRVRHSFVRLPGPGYSPRQNHPRSGFNGIAYRDYASPIGADMTQRLLSRHRLEKVDAAADRSQVVEPIVYYLDPGTPEPVRSALLEGASWWAEAFDAAGFIDAFRVEMLPENADPLDIRYNVIQWVHRATRGWSYGSSVVDPRTGEIIKGHVSLGSLRVRQDYLIAEGLLSPHDDEDEQESAGSADPMLEMALARIRQLSAHEVGHTLGLMHNFAASTYGRASVMDYPAPYVELQDDKLSLERAYGVGVGSWDRWAIRFGYGEPPAGKAEQTFLMELLEEADDGGLLYLTDSDSRGAGSMHPAGNLWDNGIDPVAELRRVMQVRAHALSRFDERAIRTDRPLATLEEVLVPIYLHHRYQLAATAKAIGGMRFEHSTRGEDGSLMNVVEPQLQRDALTEILHTLTPSSLVLPTAAREAIRPRPPGFPATRELFSGDASPAFDPYVPAEILATMVFDLLLNPQRATRLVHQRDFDPKLPGLMEMLGVVTDRIWKGPTAADSYQAEIQRTVQQVWVDALLEATGRSSASAAVRARTLSALEHLSTWIDENPGTDPETRAHRMFIHREIDRYLARGEITTDAAARATVPPGAPIGSIEHPASSRQRLRHQLVGRWAGPEHGCTTIDNDLWSLQQ